MLLVQIKIFYLQKSTISRKYQLFQWYQYQIHTLFAPLDIALYVQLVRNWNIVDR